MRCRVIGKECGDTLDAVAEVDCEHLDTCIGKPCPQIGECWDFSPAWRAPYRPERDQHRPSPIVRQTPHRAGQVRQGELRRHHVAR